LIFGELKMAMLPKDHTHIVWAYQRTGRKTGRLLECGSGRIDHDRNIAHVVMNRQPIGGYTGYVQLLPIGMKPQPEQDADTGDEGVDGED
jgi:hypothetical protein